jgi:CheY-like chemotaxis protein
MRLLIVDDNSEMRRLIRSIVGRIAGEVYECGDGSEAVEAYRNLLPDFVLMDIRMKNVDGLTATRQIIAEFPSARIVIVTDYDEATFRHDAAEAGARHYALKERLWELIDLLTTSRSK